MKSTRHMEKEYEDDDEEWRKKHTYTQFDILSVTNNFPTPQFSAAWRQFYIFIIHFIYLKFALIMYNAIPFSFEMSWLLGERVCTLLAYALRHQAGREWNVKDVGIIEVLFSFSAIKSSLLRSYIVDCKWSCQIFDSELCSALTIYFAFKLCCDHIIGWVECMVRVLPVCICPCICLGICTSSAHCRCWYRLRWLTQPLTSAQRKICRFIVSFELHFEYFLICR